MQYFFPRKIPPRTSVDAQGPHWGPLPPRRRLRGHGAQDPSDLPPPAATGAPSPVSVEGARAPGKMDPSKMDPNLTLCDPHNGYWRVGQNPNPKTIHIFAFEKLSFYKSSAVTH